jgi:hypothetical protein
LLPRLIEFRIKFVDIMVEFEFLLRVKLEFLAVKFQRFIVWLIVGIVILFIIRVDFRLVGIFFGFVRQWLVGKFWIIQQRAQHMRPYLRNRRPL